MYKLELKLSKKNLRLPSSVLTRIIKLSSISLDAVPQVMDGTLIEKLDELVGGNK